MKHFIDLADWSSDALHQLIDDALRLKAEWQNGGNPPYLQGKVLAMVFQKPSLRTRVSFDVGIQHFGGHAIMLGPDEIGLGKRESIADIARVLSGYAQGIMARVFDHDHLLQLAQWSRVPIINGLSDEQHPCQAMADILTLREHFGRVSGLRIAFIGDGNNVAASLAQAAGHFGAHFSIATPPGYTLPEAMLDRIGALMQAHGGSLRMFHDPAEAVADADCVYTDTWVSMGQEVEAATRRQAFAQYQVNADLMRRAPSHAVVLHDLPAYRGYEITDEVADGAQSLIFQQAENRLHAQKAILLKLLL
ncbi:MAG: ornithine carbamoyltransferase [Chloroflexota bacterium]|nr:ornithine carbamoyltransferase [Chloroflexota bacterium]